MVNKARDWLAGSLRLYLVTDRKVAHGSLAARVKEAVEGGITALQLRERDLSSKDLYHLAMEIKGVVGKDTLYLINDRSDIALTVEAHGVHLGWQSMPIGPVRKLLGRERLIGFSAHNLREAQEAWEAGVDYIIVGPIFPTPSKEGLVSPLGLEALQEITTASKVPVVAIGGINSANGQKVLEAGAHGLACISAILASDNVVSSTQKLTQVIKKERRR